MHSAAANLVAAVGVASIMESQNGEGLTLCFAELNTFQTGVEAVVAEL